MFVSGMIESVRLVILYDKTGRTAYRNMNARGTFVEKRSESNWRLVLPLLSFFVISASQAERRCQVAPLVLQVLGSGGPEMSDGRASTSYLVWQNGKAIVLVDAGGGSSLRFEQSGAKIETLRAIAFTHLHVDHSAAFPVLIKAAYFSSRSAELPVFGPSGNALLPSVTGFVNRLFGLSGVWPYLNDFLPGQPGSAPFRIKTVIVKPDRSGVQTVYSMDGLTLKTIGVHHGPLPALAWRIESRGKSVTISGDMNGDYGTLDDLAQETDLLVAHHAIPEDAVGVARKLHMPPSVIGAIASKAKARRLVLSHRMRRTIGQENSTMGILRSTFTKRIAFADDLDCFLIN